MHATFDEAETDSTFLGVALGGLDPFVEAFNLSTGSGRMVLLERVEIVVA